MKRIFVICCILALAACGRTPTARITATVESMPDSVVVLQKLNYNKMQRIDSIRTDVDGHFNYKLRLTGNDPYFYYLYVGGKPAASLVLHPSDQVNVRILKGGGFEVEGSEESQLLKEVNERYALASAKINGLLAQIDENTSEARLKEINTEVNRTYIDYKRKAIQWVVEHPRSITSAVVLFQNLGENLPVFAQQTDALLFKRVQDSLTLVYPRSEYIVALRDAVDARSREMELSTRFDSVDVISFPELEMPDIEGKMQKLSDLEGNVIVVSFWSVGQDEHKMFNVDLADIYSRLHERGLEVYQVSLDIDKPSWAATVRNQSLPWISVNDGMGVDSPSVLAYNVDRIPTMFIIGKDGEPVARDIFDKDALEKQLRQLL
ncbi:MAG: AhpC/TSA family protein [Bacteroidales bacterium]|nr:AhpC/TSA family protein [Bacteroidales bacterium]